MHDDIFILSIPTVHIELAKIPSIFCYQIENSLTGCLKNWILDFIAFIFFEHIDPKPQFSKYLF